MSGKGGKPRGPGPRSFDTLRRLARIDVAGIEPLGLAMGFGPRATYSHLARLAEAGLIERVYDRGGSVVAITPAGRRAIDAPRAKVSAEATRVLGIRHARALSWVAAQLTRDDREWHGHRAVRRDPGWRTEIIWRFARDGHYPDLGVHWESSRVAIEIELWHRSSARFRATLSGYSAAIAASRIAGVTYVSDRADVLDAVEDAASRVGLYDSRLVLRSLLQVQKAARKSAQEQLAGREHDPSAQKRHVQTAAGATASRGKRNRHAPSPS
jgi:DNA-binding transcriptional ArsR family regulator